MHACVCVCPEGMLAQKAVIITSGIWDYLQLAANLLEGKQLPQLLRLLLLPLGSKPLAYGASKLFEHYKQLVTSASILMKQYSL